MTVLPLTTATAAATAANTTSYSSPNGSVAFKFHREQDLSSLAGGSRYHRLRRRIHDGGRVRRHCWLGTVIMASICGCIVLYGTLLYRTTVTINTIVRLPGIDNNVDHQYNQHPFNNSNPYRNVNDNDIDDGDNHHVKIPGTQRLPTQCSIWMAPSSLIPNPGYGIFTTRSIPKYESILWNGIDAGTLPLHDMKGRRRRRGANDDGNDDDGDSNDDSDDKIPSSSKGLAKTWRNVFSNYVWNHGVPDHDRYDNPPDISDYLLGIGSLPNHHCLLASLGFVYASEPYQDGMLGFYNTNNTISPDNHSDDRNVHSFETMNNMTHDENDVAIVTSSTVNNTMSPASPGMGAFSYSLGRIFYASKDLQEGDEIFLNYGLCEREPPYDEGDWSNKIIFPQDVREVANILELYEPFGTVQWPTLENGTTNVTHLLEGRQFGYGPTKAKRRFVIAFLSMFSTSKRRQELKDAVNRDIQRVVAQTGSGLTRKERQKVLVRHVAKGALRRRDVDWIRSHGHCLENLIPKRSLLPDAGFGGFAQFPIREGEIVVPAPALHVVNEKRLKLYERGRYKNGDEEKKFRREIGTSLLVNYCFGHNQSSLLLCPMTSATLLNHCSNRTRSCGPLGPNAKVQWSSGWDPPSHAFRTKSLDYLDGQVGRLLSLEVVAIRDIAPGEEVYIDYGEDWETAWEDHLKHWTPPPRNASFISAQVANRDMGPILPDLISGDLRKGVDHPYLFTGCQYEESEEDDTNRWNVTDKNWKDRPDEDILGRYATEGDEFVYDDDEGYEGHSDRSHWPCTVLMKSDSGHDDRYTVRIHQSPLRGVEPWETSWHMNRLPRILTNYSRNSIHYFVKPEAADQLLPNVFRHSIGFPDHLFPKQWMNL